MHMTPEERIKIDDFITRLSLMRSEAIDLGFVLTSQKIKDASRQVGWDLEYLITKDEIDEKSTF